ncbi:hypothetical protein B0H13DRAFT_1915775 [Mycena leptocephala]|nr:hypothetical protein B0H13DRAFT_1915775 [Mycena leptocephala]
MTSEATPRPSPSVETLNHYDDHRRIRIPPAREHIRSQEIIAASDLLFLETWPFASQNERDIFVKSNFASLFAKVDSFPFTRSFRSSEAAAIPDGEFEKMIWTSRLATLLWLTDDWIEREPPERMAGIITGRLAVYPMICEFLRSMPEFLDYRRLNFGGDFILAVTRYAIDTYVTDDELQNPLLAACQTLAIGVHGPRLSQCSRGIDDGERWVVVLVVDNGPHSVDVASYEMEVQENTADNNVVTMLLKHGVDGHTFTSASAAKIYVRNESNSVR